MMLDDLVKYLEGQVDGLRKEAYSLDTALSALIKKCTNILDEQKSETDRMLDERFENFKNSLPVLLDRQVRVSGTFVYNNIFISRY